MYLLIFLISLIGLLFMMTGIDKVMHWKKHLYSIDSYNIIPEFLQYPALVLFTLSELFVGVSFLLFQVFLINIIVSLSLLLIYTIAIIISLWNGNRNMSCGCGGVLESENLNFRIVIRNLTLILICVSIFFLHNTTVVIFSWLNISTTIIFSVGVLILYGICEKIFLDLQKMKTILKKF